MELPKGMDFGEVGNEFIELIKDHCVEITALIYSHIKDASRQSLKNIISLCVLQGYMNGCFDTISSEKDTTHAYLVKLRKLLIPVQILLEANLRRIEEEDSQKPDSSR